jgi:hypothetical protein
MARALREPRTNHTPHGKHTVRPQSRVSNGQFANHRPCGDLTNTKGTGPAHEISATDFFLKSLLPVAPRFIWVKTSLEPCLQQTTLQKKTVARADVAGCQ